MAQLDLDGNKKPCCTQDGLKKFNVHQHTSLLSDKAVVRSECCVNTVGSCTVLFSIFNLILIF